jgi:hypothetical protein
MTTKSSNLVVSDDGDGGGDGANGVPVDFASILHSYLHSPIFKKIFTSTYLKIIYAYAKKIKASSPARLVALGFNASIVKRLIY